MSSVPFTIIEREVFSADHKGDVLTWDEFMNDPRYALGYPSDEDSSDHGFNTLVATSGMLESVNNVLFVENKVVTCVIFNQLDPSYKLLPILQRVHLFVGALKGKWKIDVDVSICLKRSPKNGIHIYVINVKEFERQNTSSSS